MPSERRAQETSALGADGLADVLMKEAESAVRVRWYIVWELRVHLVLKGVMRVMSGLP